MTRIVGGSLGGRRLRTPTGERTRPTSDRVREALFNTLASLTDLAGVRFADLYAGSGAVGLEACSRGAGQVLLVESGPRAARIARANIAALGAHQTVRLIVGDVAAVLRQPLDGRPPDGQPLDDRSYGIVFADPPYALADGALVTLQRDLVDGGWLGPGGILVVERATRSGQFPWVEPVTGVRARRYGETTLWYGRRP